MSLADRIEDVLPGWMRAESRTHWVGVAYAFSLIVDSLIDGLYDGRRASFPGQTGLVPDLGGYFSVDALPVIGRDRRLPKGLAESFAAYARRLRNWRTAWRAAGTARGLLLQLRAATAPSNVRIRLVSAAGQWHTLETDGTFRLQNNYGQGFVIHPNGTTSYDVGIAHPWDWDSSDPSLANPFRLWVIIYAPAAPPLDDDEGRLGDSLSFYGDPFMTIGTAATTPYVEQVKGVISEWKAAGVIVPNIIISFDPTAFDPLTPGPYPAPGMPDGTWQNHGRVIGGVRVATRFPLARYWKGPQ